ncbi:BTB/POZ domain-containing protein [Nymphaea thermarum]|nr:BTB/POZ domain-containing protein [Nymphaea thermarum]
MSCTFSLLLQGIISSYSGKVSQIFQQQSASVTNLHGRPPRVALNDLPGGSEAFELLTRFCYSDGKTHITPSNVCRLHCAAIFMEMTEELHTNNLVTQTDRFLQGMVYWTWSENLVVLKQCQEFIAPATSSGILYKIINSMLLKLAANSESSPSSSSPESSSVRFSCDTKSSEFTKNSGQSWWFEDLSGLSTLVIEKFIMEMVRHKIDNLIISRFLFYYFKCRFPSSTPIEKLEITEAVVNLLSLLDKSSISCKGLFAILRMNSGLALSKSCRDQLESMIGSQLDQATLDNLLFPASVKMGSLYDVNLVLRFLKSFIGGDGISATALKRVGVLMDKYIAEVAPDSSLKPSKFIALVKALPDSARESYDEIYRALDMYLEVHAGLSEEDKVKICRVLNHEKLEACKHITKNSNFPSRAAIQAVISQQSKLKSLLEGYDHFSSDINTTPLSYKSKVSKSTCHEVGDQIVLLAKKVDLSMENEKLKAHLQGMQWKVIELEKMCKKMQNQISKMMMKNKVASHGNARLPRLCS